MAEEKQVEEKATETQENQTTEETTTQAETPAINIPKVVDEPTAPAPKAKPKRNAMKIAVFASGEGTNAQRLVEFFRGEYGRDNGDVVLIVTSDPEAGVIARAEELKVECLVINEKKWTAKKSILKDLQDRKIDMVVLAGWLWLVPEVMVDAMPKQIINIHPSLLPAHGGKGMYGMHVHNAVKEAGDTRTGITIHYVDEDYDAGEIIFQEQCPVLYEDSLEDIAARVQVMEHQYYPLITYRVADKIREAKKTAKKKK